MDHLQEEGRNEKADKLIMILKGIYVNMYICNRRDCNEGCVGFLFFFCKRLFYMGFSCFFGFDFILDLLFGSALSSTNAALLNTMVGPF